MTSTTRVLQGTLTLPAEIIVIVLELFIPRGESRHELVSVTNLTGVCRYWRHFIVSTPKFWTSIRIESCYNVRKIKYQHYIAGLETQLQRTGTNLLDVSYHINSGNVRPEIADIMRKYAPLERWRTLSLCLTRGKFKGALLAGIPTRRSPVIVPYEEGSLINLEEMTLYGHGSLTVDLVDLVESTALRLRRFTVGTTYYHVIEYYFPKTLRRIKTKAADELFTQQ